MLFQAASPRPRTQLSSLSGEPRAPCFVSAQSPVPTLRIWTRKKQRVDQLATSRYLPGPLLGWGEGNKAEASYGLSAELS